MQKFHKTINTQVTKMSLNFSVKTRVRLNRHEGYNSYTKLLVNEIKSMRNMGYMYKDITNHLKDRGFRSSRNKEMSTKLTERMLKKKYISERRHVEEFVSYEDIELNIETIGE